MRSYATLLASLLLGLALLSSAAHGQATASIVGTVTEPSGAAVANAKVTIASVETGFARSTVSNSSGSYAVHELPSDTTGSALRRRTLKPKSRAGLPWK